MATVLGLLVAAALATPSGAVTEVYHSPGDDGVSPGPGAEISVGAGQTLFVYISGGPSPTSSGERCHDGDGDELCGYELVLTGQGGLTLSGFTPDPAANIVANLSGNELRLNDLDTTTPSPGPRRIGELVVDAPASGVLELSSGEAIRADLSSDVLPMSTIVAVPEPTRLALLGSGLAWLSCLLRRRGRR